MTAPAVVIHVGSPYGKDGPANGVELDGDLPRVSSAGRPEMKGDFAGAQDGGFCPHELHRRFPSQWSAAMQTAYRGPRQIPRICLDFGVDARTARDWISGTVGCNGRHVVNFTRRHPEIASAYLYNMAAE